ncbi:MAG: hypothetical protein ACLPJW_17565 [Rhodomicrobium sp.]
MKNRLGLIVIAAIAAAGLAACAQTAQKNLQLIAGLKGNWANPSSGVLSGLCITQCNADACMDFDTLTNLCVQGLPVQGVIGSEVRTIGCPDLNYATSGAVTLLQLPATCIQPLPTSTPAPTPAPTAAPSAAAATH